jgi:O-antigen/teichoic acid export membrane protein
MKNKKIVINVISSGGQIAVIGIVYFFLYKYLVKHLGVELLGVWSVVMATSSIANLANFGVSTSVVRFVALYLKDGRESNIRNLIFTSVIFILGFFLVLSLLIYPFADILLQYVIDAKYINTALEILPYSIGCLILNAIAGVYASVLDGMQKNYLRSIVFTLSSLVLLGLTYSLTIKYGLKGVVWAQLAQSFFTILGSLFIVIKLTNFNPFKWQWDKTIFKEIFSYGIKFQIISLSVMFNEPVTKLLLAKYGGLQFTGYYEMANRLIMQLRGVVTNANQSLIPLLVKNNNDSVSVDNSNRIYKISFFCISIISLIMLTFPIIFSGFISQIWIGSQQLVFVNLLLLTVISVYINLLCGPSYFAFIAEGKLNPIIKAQVFIASFNVFFGFLLGYYFGGYGVAIAWLIAVIVGTVFLLNYYSKLLTISFFSNFKKEVIWLVFQISFIIVLKYIFMSYFLKNMQLEIMLFGVFIIILSFNIYLIYIRIKRRILII